MKKKKLTIIEYAKILDQLLVDSEDIDQSLDVYLDFLKKREVLNSSDAIIDAYLLLNDSKQGKTHIIIRSKDVLDSEIKDNISSALNAVRVGFVLDSEILGGVKVETQDELFDFTLNAQIKKLKQYLIEE